MRRARPTGLSARGDVPHSQIACTKMLGHARASCHPYKMMRAWRTCITGEIVWPGSRT